MAISQLSYHANEVISSHKHMVTIHHVAVSLIKTDHINMHHFVWENQRNCRYIINQ